VLTKTHTNTITFWQMPKSNLIMSQHTSNKIQFGICDTTHVWAWSFIQTSGRRILDLLWTSKKSSEFYFSLSIMQHFSAFFLSSCHLLKDGFCLLSVLLHLNCSFIIPVDDLRRHSMLDATTKTLWHNAYIRGGLRELHKQIASIEIRLDFQQCRCTRKTEHFT